MAAIYCLHLYLTRQRGPGSVPCYVSALPHPELKTLTTASIIMREIGRKGETYLGMVIQQLAVWGTVSLLRSVQLFLCKSRS